MFLTWFAHFLLNTLSPLVNNWILRCINISFSEKPDSAFVRIEKHKAWRQPYHGCLSTDLSALHTKEKISRERREKRIYLSQKSSYLISHKLLSPECQQHRHSEGSRTVHQLLQLPTACFTSWMHTPLQPLMENMWKTTTSAQLCLIIQRCARCRYFGHST